MEKLKILVKENPELREFFEEISTWICENDYECGPVGSDIFDRISNLIDNNK